jgi:hypothetical protein
MARMVFGNWKSSDMSDRRLRGTVVHASGNGETVCKRLIRNGLYALNATLGRNRERINCKQCLKEL